jgi:hypothetical protein
MKTMKTILIAGSLLTNGLAMAHNQPNNMIHHETIVCDAKHGCEVVCKQPGDKWSSYLKTEGNIEVTYFMTTGVRQLKADMGGGQHTILDTHPELQSCRISGVQ